MKSTHTFSISFFLKKDKTKNGRTPLFARVTVDGAFTDISTKQRVETGSWNQNRQMLSGKGAEETLVREKMRLLINDLNNAYNDLRHEKKVVTAEAIKAKVDGSDKDRCSLTFLMRYHNTELASLLEPGTLKNYFSTERFLWEFLIKKRKSKDILLDSVGNKFITDFGIFMLNRVPDKGQKPCGNNTLRYTNSWLETENLTIFPFFSNQVVNRYLKTLAKKAKIDKVITFHLARHTFATTVTLENGVPMESVSHMLGHASIRTTQIYSKVKKKKVLEDMSRLRNKLDSSMLNIVGK